jgi:hypothetical protein
MYRLRFVFAGVLLLFAVGLLATALPAAAQSAVAPVSLTFDKAIVDPAGVWEGTVAGDLEGDLTTVLTALEISGPIWHVEFDWIVDTGDEYSFTAHLSGILNTYTGGVVMNGRVSEGYLLGAQVHEEGQLIDPETLRFQGSIQLMPATAD